MAERSEDTGAYYKRNAERFAADTVGLDMSVLYERFLHHIPPGGRILDAGCSVGSDAPAFVERRFSLVAFDASTEMVRLAQERVAGLAVVLHMHFEELSRHEEFDGIWACASLLHVSAAVFPSVATKLAAALRTGGALYMSFRLGHGERVTNGRRFIDHTEETLRAAVDSTVLTFAEVWTTTDVRVGRSSEVWLNVIAVRPRR